MSFILTLGQSGVATLGQSSDKGIIDIEQKNSMKKCSATMFSKTMHITYYGHEFLCSSIVVLTGTIPRCKKDKSQVQNSRGAWWWMKSEEKRVDSFFGGCEEEEFSAAACCCSGRIRIPVH